MQDEQTVDPRMRNTERPVLTAADCGDSDAARTWHPLVQPGMEVLGGDGDEVGQVKEVRSGDFLIDRSRALGLETDSLIYVSFERIHSIMGDRISLDVPAAEVDEYGFVPGPLKL